jgi:hypothetical protein
MFICLMCKSVVAKLKALQIVQEWDIICLVYSSYRNIFQMNIAYLSWRCIIYNVAICL